jgi:OmpA-OmpF porin, OOP family
VPSRPESLHLTQFLRRLSTITLALLAFIIAAMVMVVVAYASALMIEGRTQAVVTARLAEQRIDWITVRSDGLQVHLTGTAPSEVARFRAVNLVGALVDSSRIRDGLDVTPALAIKAPDFSVQMLRTDDGVQLIGLMPETTDEASLTRAALAEAAAAIMPETALTDMLETAGHPVPETWDAALAFGLEALRRLPQSKISVAAGQV